MRRIRLATVAALTACAACATGGEAAVETVFHSYHRALQARDFATACALNAPETNTKLIARITAQGTEVRTCEEAWAAVYALPGAGRVADGVGRTAQVQDITIDGDAATISWTFEQTAGRRLRVDTGLRCIDDQWRLLDTS